MATHAACEDKQDKIRIDFGTFFSPASERVVKRTARASADFYTKATAYRLSSTKKDFSTQQNQTSVSAVPCRSITINGGLIAIAPLVMVSWRRSTPRIDRNAFATLLVSSQSGCLRLSPALTRQSCSWPRAAKASSGLAERNNIHRFRCVVLHTKGEDTASSVALRKSSQDRSAY